MKKKDYEKPTMQVIELQQQAYLLQASAPNQASFKDYEDGEFSWD